MDHCHLKTQGSGRNSEGIILKVNRVTPAATTQRGAQEVRATSCIGFSPQGRRRWLLRGIEVRGALHNFPGLGWHSGSMGEPQVRRTIQLSPALACGGLPHCCLPWRETPPCPSAVLSHITPDSQVSRHAEKQDGAREGGDRSNRD